MQNQFFKAMVAELKLSSSESLYKLSVIKNQAKFVMDKLDEEESESSVTGDDYNSQPDERE